MTSRGSQRWITAGTIVLAGLAAAAVPPPPALGAAQSGATRAFAALAAASIVALAAAPQLLWPSMWRRAAWTAVAVLSLAVGIASFVVNAMSTRACTAQYDGRAVLIGTEWTSLGERYATENPGLSKEELLFDSAGVADRLWTRASIESCRTRVAATYVLWIPCLLVSLMAAGQAARAGALPDVSRARRASAIAVNGHTPGAEARYDIFISYRHGGRDGEFARELLLALERDGYRVAIDERDFPANANFLQEMERCVRESRFTVSLISPRYLGSGHCEEEAILCKVLDMGDRKRRLIPMIIEPVELPAWLFGLVGIDCTRPDPLVDPLDRLRAVLGSPPAAPERSRSGAY